MSFADMLVNSVVHERRTTTPNGTGEEVESFTDVATLPASVQDRGTRPVSVPDIDGPIIVNAIIYTKYFPPGVIRHLDRLRRVDVSPERRYQVIDPGDAAGRVHHLEIACQRVEEVEIEAGS